MAEIQKFHTFITQEGENGAIRGKIPVAMARQLNADDGSVIEWQVQGRTVLGARVLRGKDADRVRTSRTSVTSTPKSTSKKVKPALKKETGTKTGKDVGKKASAKLPVPGKKAGKDKGQKIAAPKVKSSKRKTFVKYDDPKPKKGGKGTLPKLKLGKR